MITSRMRRRSQGFTLIETLMAVTIFTFIVSVFGWATVNMTRLGNVVTSSSKLQSDSRLHIDQFLQDAHSASSVLATYAYAGVTYVSSPSSTMILKAPSYDASGNILATYDYIVYHLAGASAPYTLNRFVVVTSGVRPSSVDTVIVRDVLSVSFVSLVDQKISGDGAVATFDLNSAVAGTGSGLVTTVTMNGAIIAPGAGAAQAQFLAPTSQKPLGQIQFGAAPPANAVIDLLYSVNPALSANQPNVTSISADMTVQTIDPSLSGSSIQSDEISGRTNLHNH